MISIRDALMAAGHGDEAEELLRLDKYELIDSDGTSLGWKTWDEIVSKYSLETRVSNRKTSSLPWNATKPSGNTTTVKLHNITARDIAHLPSSEEPADAPISRAPEPNVAAQKSAIPKRWAAFEPLDATYSLYDLDGRYVGERTMREVLRTFDLRWTFYLDGIKMGKPPKSKKTPSEKMPTKKGRRKQDKPSLIEYVAPTPPPSKKASNKKVSKGDAETQAIAKHVSSPKDKHEANAKSVPDRDRRPSLLERYLSAYPDEVQNYVRKMLPRPDVDIFVSRELSRHPDRYVTIEPYQNVLRRVTALANIYLHHDEDKLEDLMDRAHLFVFDDDAWWAAKNCTDPLARLPYDVCIVEDVVLYNEKGVIHVKALSDRADVDEAKRLLAFVVNSCGKIEMGEISDYVTTESVNETVVKNESHTSALPKRGRSSCCVPTGC